MPIEAEYLISVEKLKQEVTTNPTMNIDDIKHKYEKIYEHLDQQHGRTLLSSALIVLLFNIKLIKLILLFSMHA